MEKDLARKCGAKPVLPSNASLDSAHLACGGRVASSKDAMVQTIQALAGAGTLERDRS